jgi:hypothetical protein
VKANINHHKSGGTFLEGVLAMVYSLIIASLPVGFYLFSPEVDKQEVSFEMASVVERLKVGDDWIHMQRKDIETMSKALKDGTITSKHLKQDGDSWIREQKLRVDVREAKIFLSQLQSVEKRSCNRLRKWEVEESDRLVEKIEAQLQSPFAQEEGLDITKADLDLIIYRIHSAVMSPK